MDSSTAHRKAQKAGRQAQSRRRTSTTTSTSWCCSFKSPPKSPDTLSLSSSSKIHTIKKHQQLGPTSESNQSKPPSSYPGSPQSSKSGLSLVGRIDPRRILSPGRVSPIDSDPTAEPTKRNAGRDDDEYEATVAQEEVGSTRSPDLDVDYERESEGDCCDGGLFDVRLNLKAKSGGGFLVLELNSVVLAENSPVFASLIEDCWKDSRRNCGEGAGGGRFCRIEVPEIENLGVFRETIELMFEKDITKKLIKIGAYRAIDILEVSASIRFNRGVVSCLKYLEAVPWTEEEEEKLRRLFGKFKFDKAISNEILSRFSFADTCGAQQKLASKLVYSITSSDNVKARNELKSMVKGLLFKSSVYKKDHLDVTKDDLYSVSQYCLSSLVTLFQEASGPIPLEQVAKANPDKPLIESVSWQVENLNWLLEILLDHQIAEDFVDIWANQKELLEMHNQASPMVRYELSRVSARLFVAIATRLLQCRAETRFRLLRSWFGPMLQDFGWLKRCRKGLDMRELEEAMGQALLTLPLKQQYPLFMEWFKCFSKHGTECPNLSKAFQIWWRRSFLRGSETHAIESR